MSNEQLISLLATRVAERLELKLQEMSGHKTRVQPRLLTVREAAIYLGRSESAVRHLLNRKILPSLKVGKRIHLDRLELNKWIEARKR